MDDSPVKRVVQSAQTTPIVASQRKSPVGCPQIQMPGPAGYGLSRRSFIGGLSAAVAGVISASACPAFGVETGTPSRPMLFTNLRLFDGVSRNVREGVNVLVDQNRISALPAVDQAVDNAQLIDCGGRLLMPGLIDAHWHAMFCGISEARAMRSTVGYLYLVAAQEAERTLMRGFTSVRDVGGPSFDLKRAIDEGIATGPRIYPSGAMISQTSGHGDFRLRSEIPRSDASALSYAEVLRRVREQLMLGASQIKLMAGGGVSSPYDPLDTTQYSEEELRAAVGAAEDWGTYVMVHVYTPRGIQRAVRAGAKSIEQGQAVAGRRGYQKGLPLGPRPRYQDRMGYGYPVYAQ